jgi:colicin import membrane protein
MAGEMPSPTISLRERSFPLEGSEERLPRWLLVSCLLHLVLIACLFVAPMLPAPAGPVHPVYVVDLIGGEKIGGANLGTELTPPPKTTRVPEVEKAPVSSEIKKEIKKEPVEKKEPIEKVKAVEKKAPQEDKLVVNEKVKADSAKKEPVKEIKDEAKVEASADNVRERLLQSAVERAKARGESTQKSAKGEVLSAGTGEGEGAAALGAGGRGGPGVVRGIDFVIYQNRMLTTIKENWAWVGQRSNLRVVVHFGIKENGEIIGLKIVQPSGDPSYDESVVRAVKKSSPLPVPPENYRKDFADVELTFRPRDLGA